MIGRILRGLAYVAAAGVMLLAILVGIARLLLPTVPEYQDDIRRWAREATGFNVEFENISASWPLAGPELRFFNVTITAQAGQQPVFIADALTVGVSLVHLLRDQEFTLSRIGVENTRLEIQRDAVGTILIQGLPIGDLVQFDTDLDETQGLPDLRIELSEIAVAYKDAQRGDLALNFVVDQLDLRVSEDGIALDGDLLFASEFGGRAALSLDLPAALLRAELLSDDGSDEDANPWKVYLAAEELQLGRMMEFWLDMEVPFRNARGDVVVWGELAGMKPRSITTEVNLTDIELPGANGSVEAYQLISGEFEWGIQDGGWVLAGNDVEITRRNQASPTSAFSVAYAPTASGASTTLLVKASFFRLHDWYPLILGIASDEVRTSILLSDVRGDLSDVNMDLRLNANRPAEYELDMDFAELGFSNLGGGEALSGVSGSVVADQEGGRLQIDSKVPTLDLPTLFSGQIGADSIEGFLVWRVTADQIRVLSDNVQIRTALIDASSRFELSLPRNGDSPYIDLTGVVTASDARAVLRYLPLQKFSPKLTAWLNRAIVGGRINEAQIALRGALRKFPFPRGDGVFRIALDVESGILDYADKWPRVENLNGEIIFDGVSLTSARNQGRIGGISASNITVTIPDLRNGLIDISGRQTVDLDEILRFIRATPINTALGAKFSQVTGSGTVESNLQIMLPIKQLQEYDLNLVLEAKDALLGLEDVGFGFSGVSGSLTVKNTQLFADDLTAELLGEPVSIRIRPVVTANSPYRHLARVSGATPVGRWMEVLRLPFAERLAGSIDWRAVILFPARRDENTAPLHILVHSDLIGVDSRMPAPLAKAAEISAALQLDIAFPEESVLEVSGRLRRDLTWAMRLESAEQRWEIERGAIHAGSAAALLPIEPGVELSGRLELLRFDEWLELRGDGDDAGWQELYREAVLDIDRLSLFGQVFPDVEVEANRGEADWEITLSSPNLEGRITVPLDLSADRPIRLGMDRLWLLESDSVDTGQQDPRAILSAKIDVVDFALGDMRFGSLNAELKSVPSGVIAEPIKTRTEFFSIEGDGAWLVHPNDDTLQQSRLKFSLDGNDIGATLTGLGYERVIGGDTVKASAELTWRGAPSADFLQRADGKFQVAMEEGALLNIDPGTGRILGVVSLAALPRRLALDFSDVFDDGLAFDTLQGDFTIDDGNAYTCNLGLEGSVADLGVVGRAGFEGTDYDQLAVIRPHMSNLLALGGTVVGGPGVGAAMLIFSQIFRKPLSILGESYYRITGQWDDPDVRRIQGDELDVAPLRNCETFLSESITETLKE